MSEDLFLDIQDQLRQNRVVLYMKGTPHFPQCGFSHRVAQLLSHHRLNFGYVDVLSHPNMRKRLPLYSNWPTFPQIFIDGQLIGGCDILMEMEENGEIESLIQELSLPQNSQIIACE